MWTEVSLVDQIKKIMSHKTSMKQTVTSKETEANLILYTTSLFLSLQYN